MLGVGLLSFATLGLIKNRASISGVSHDFTARQTSLTIYTMSDTESLDDLDRIAQLKNQCLRSSRCPYGHPSLIDP